MSGARNTIGAKLSDICYLEEFVRRESQIILRYDLARVARVYSYSHESPSILSEGYKNGHRMKSEHVQARVGQNVFVVCVCFE